MAQREQERRITVLETTVHHQEQELASLRSQVSFMSQILADIHETTSMLVKKAVSSPQPMEADRLPTIVEYAVVEAKEEPVRKSPKKLHEDHSHRRRAV